MENEKESILEKRWEFYYNEACEAFRHYSNHVREIRRLSIVQGVTLLAGTGLLINSENYIEAAGTAIFGILATLTLWSFHKMYFDHSMNMQQYIETVLENKVGPWSNHREIRRKFLEGKIKHQLFKHGVYFLMIISLITLLTITLIKHFNN